MTEQEYIYVRDLSNVMVALNCVRDMNPGFSVMTEAEHSKVVCMLKKWQDALFEHTTTKE